MPHATKKQFKIGNNAGFIRISRVRQKILKVWKGEDVAYWEKRRLLSAGLVEQVDGAYKITEAGRWVAIACVLGMSMTKMYIMADMYVAYCTWKERGATGVFPIEWTRAKLDTFLEPHTINNRISDLRRTGMIEKVSHGLYTITPAGATCLAQYHKDVLAMHAYMYRRL